MLPPELVAVWHPTRNLPLTVEEAFPKSTRPRWWQCPEGHEWEQRVALLTNIAAKVAAGKRTSLCRACDGVGVVPGRTDLAAVHPALLPFWAEENTLKPQEVSPGSMKTASWQCPEGHSWDRVIRNQVIQGAVCTHCSRETRKLERQQSKDISSEPMKRRNLLADHPLSSELHPTLNEAGLRETITIGSNTEVWWQCEQNHSWKAKPSNRSRRGDGCPYCSGRYAIPGETDLATVAPDLAKFWDFEKNQLTPEQVKASSHTLVWWKCDFGHEFYNKPFDLVGKKTYCSQCSGYAVAPGETDLFTVHPHLRSFWHSTRNGDLDPITVSPANALVVWWQCPKGHEWDSPVYSMTLPVRKTSTGCPVCSGVRVVAGVNDFATKYPAVASQWHPTKNGDATPDQFTWGSGHKAWWLCEKNHEWKASLDHRGRGESGCPDCWGNVSKQEKALLESLKEHYTGRIVESTKKVIRPYEIDIYFPDAKLGVEFNGVYWHSEDQGKDRNYHRRKWELAQKAGIQLIQVWEDDWTRSPQLVTEMILHKLGVSPRGRTFARKTVTVELERTEANEFLDKNHIQGAVDGSIRLGLQEKDSGELVAVLVMKWEAGSEQTVLNILRYSTSKTVVGGFTKLLKAAEVLFQPSGFITFADHNVSDGGLYANNGFIADKQISADYMYVVKNERKHKFNYRLKRFREDPNLKWEDGLSERDLARLNKIPRVWDSGKTRWVKTVL